MNEATLIITTLLNEATLIITTLTCCAHDLTICFVKCCMHLHPSKTFRLSLQAFLLYLARWDLVLRVVGEVQECTAPLLLDALRARVAPHRGDDRAHAALLYDRDLTTDSTSMKFPKKKQQFCIYSQGSLASNSLPFS